MNGISLGRSFFLARFLLIKLIFVCLSDGQSTDIRDSMVSRYETEEFETGQEKVGRAKVKNYLFYFLPIVILRRTFLQNRV